MNIETVNVVPLRQVSNVLIVAPSPKVFTPAVVHKLAAANKTLRLLRDHHQPVKAIDLDGPQPTIHVDASAAAWLVPIAHGFNVRRPLGGGEPVTSVIVGGCTICWPGWGMA
jgi:hypothetical protein